MYRFQRRWNNVSNAGVKGVVHIPGRCREGVAHSDIASLAFDVGSASSWKWPSSEISLEEALGAVTPLSIPYS